MKFPSGDQAAVVLHPGKEPLDFPSATIAAQRAPILGLPLAVRSVGREHCNAVFIHLRVERIRAVGLVADEPFGEFVEEASGQNASASRHSAGEALSTDTARGRPSPEAIATILVPLPRLVGPTAKLPFWRSRSSHPRTLHPDSTCLAHTVDGQAGATPRSTCLHAPTAGRTPGAIRNPGARIRMLGATDE